MFVTERSLADVSNTLKKMRWFPPMGDITAFSLNLSEFVEFRDHTARKQSASFRRPAQADGFSRRRWQSS